MTYFLFFSAICLGLIFPKSKIASGYILVCLYLLAAFNNQNVDYYSYTISYKNSSISSGYRYLGYTYFSQFFSSRGVTYEDYLKILFFIILLILYVAICLSCSKPNIVLALFTIFPFGVDVVQVKAFSSEVLSLLSVIILINALSDKHQDCKNLFLYFVSAILILAAGSMHYSALYYLVVEFVFVLLAKRHNYTRKILVLLIVIAGVLSSGLIPFALKMGARFGLISNMDYLSQWGIRSTRLGFLVTFTGVILLLLSTVHRSGDNADYSKTVLMRRFLFASVFLFPLLMINWSYDRLIRVYAIILYIYFANKKRNFVIPVRQLCSIIVLLFFIMYMYGIDIFTAYEGTLGAIFSHSLLF